MSSYPDEMVRWFRIYFGKPPDKLTHDAHLHFAEAGAQRLAVIAYSVYRETTLSPVGAIDLLQGYPLGFRDWVRLLLACLPEVPQLGWDFSTLDGALSASAQIRSGLGPLRKTWEHCGIGPLRTAMQDISGPPLSWSAAWDVLVTYRNRTLGHPHPTVIGAEGFYELMTPKIGTVVVELLCNPVVAQIFQDYPVALYEGISRYGWWNVGVQGPSGSFPTREVKAEQRDGLYKGLQLVVRRAGLRPPSLLAVIHDPQRTPSFEPGGRAVDEPNLYDDGVSATDGEVEPIESHDAEKAKEEAPGEPVDLSTGALVCQYEEKAMVLVRPGRLRVRGSNGRPRTVTLTRSFRIARFLVTEAQYDSVMHDNPSHFVGPTLPVDSVSWREAVTLCNCLSEIAGYQPVYDVSGRTIGADLSQDGFRLPTECEWEYAAREGGMDHEPTKGLGATWWKGTAQGTTHPVGEWPSNRLGLSDMLGNLREWCHDRYQDNFPSSTSDPSGAEAGVNRVLRGGSWKDDEEVLKTTYRFFDREGAKDSRYGLRLARSNSPPPEHARRA